VTPACTAKVKALRSLVEPLRAAVPEFRREQALAYPVAGMLALFRGVRCGPTDLAAYAATLSQRPLRALRFRCQPGTRRGRCPDRTTFDRVLQGVDAVAVERVRRGSGRRRLWRGCCLTNEQRSETRRRE
jgi:hypothetical protein